MWNEVKKDEKEGHRSSRKCDVLCYDDVDYCLRIGRRCGSCSKHMEYCKVAGGVGRKQRCIPRN